MMLDRKQFTMGSMMIAVAIFAVLFVNRELFAVIVVAIFLPLIPALPIIVLYGLVAAVKFVTLRYRRGGISVPGATGSMIERPGPP